MNHLLALPVLVPMAAGALLLILAPLGLRTLRTVSLAATFALTPIACVLLARAASGEVDVYYIGGWPAPFGIVLVLDRLSAMMLMLNAILAAAAASYACCGDDQRGARFHALFQFLLLGINGAFLTGDLFNLFVCFEILLIASYGLLLHGGGAMRVRAGLHVVALNLAGSGLFLVAVGAIYASAGTLNLADLSHKVASLEPQTAGPLRAGALLLFAVFALKAAVVPLGFWLPGAYASASAPAAAVFAIMTKVGIYAVVRVHGLVFGPDAGVAASVAQPWLLPAGLITVAIGTAGVVAARELHRLLAHLVVVSAGSLLAALGLGSTQGTAAALYYLANSTLVAGALFLLADLIANQRAHARATLDVAMPVSQPVLLGCLFLVGAAGVAGLPPFAGFAAKVWVLQSAIDAGYGAWVLSVLLASALLVIVALARACSALFWRTGDAAPSGVRAPLGSATATAALLAGSLILIVAAGPVGNYAEHAAAQLDDRDGYIEAVLSNRGAGRSVPDSVARVER